MMLAIALVCSFLVFSLLVICSGGLVFFSRKKQGGWLVVVSSLLIPLMALAIYLPQGLSLGAGFDMALSERVNELDKALSSQQRQKVLRSIEALLVSTLTQNDPADHHLQLLAETYSSLNMTAAAVDVYERLEQRYPADPMTLTLLAQAKFLMLNRANSLTADQISSSRSQVSALLDRALDVEPTFPLALSLSGMQSFQVKQYQQAIKAWTKALNQYDQSTPEALSLKKGIELARVKSLSPTNIKSPASSIIRLYIELSPDHAGDDIPPSTPVFIFARAENGGRIPLAAKKIRVIDLPTEVILTEHDKMAEDSLSDHQRVSVVARLALSGQAIFQDGDMQSQRSVVRVESSYVLAPLHGLMID